MSSVDANSVEQVGLVLRTVQGSVKEENVWKGAGDGYRGRATPSKDSQFYSELGTLLVVSRRQFS